MKNLFLISISILISLFLISCNESETQKNEDTEKVTLELQFFVEDQPLKLLQEYENDLGQRYLLEDFKFYLSNFEFEPTTSNQAIKVEDSYLLFSAEREKNTFQREFNLERGTYSSISFSIGVDSIKNTSLDNTGDLDINNSMAWDWNTGYKFVVVEGKYYNNPSEPTSSIPLVFHIGHNQNYKTISLPFQEIFDTQNENKITLKIDLNAVFNAPNQIDFNETNNVMGLGKSLLFSENYKEGFVVLE